MFLYVLLGGITIGCIYFTLKYGRTSYLFAHHKITTLSKVCLEWVTSLVNMYMHLTHQLSYSSSMFTMWHHYCFHVSRGVPVAPGFHQRFTIRRLWVRVPVGPWRNWTFPQCNHYWVIKGHGVWCPVYGTLHVKDPLPFFEKSRVVIPMAGFSRSSHRFDHQRLIKWPTLFSPWYDHICWYSVKPQYSLTHSLTHSQSHNLTHSPMFLPWAMVKQVICQH